MSSDGPALVIALLLQCLHGNVNPTRLHMQISTAPSMLGEQPGAPVYLARIGSSRIYQFKSATDEEHGIRDDCGIAVYDDLSARYFQKVVRLLEGARWKYKVDYHRLKADDNVSEVMDLHRGGGSLVADRVSITALPPQWRGVSSAFIPGADYPTLLIRQGHGAPDY